MRVGSLPVVSSNLLIKIKNPASDDTYEPSKGIKTDGYQPYRNIDITVHWILKKKSLYNS